MQKLHLLELTKKHILDLSKDNVADGAKSDLALEISFFDCSYSNLAIIKSGLFFFDISIAEFNSSGNIGPVTEDLSNSSGLFNFPITFS